MSTKEQAHTAGPWILIDGDETDSSFDDGKLIITTQRRFEDGKVSIAEIEADYSEPFSAEQKANAARIVLAVNCHDELVAALREAEGELYQVPPADAEQERVLAIVRAAIARATGAAK